MALSHQEKKGGKEYTTFSLETIHLITECQIKVKLLNRRPLDLVPLMCRGRAEQGHHQRDRVKGPARIFCCSGKEDGSGTALMSAPPSPFSQMMQILIVLQADLHRTSSYVTLRQMKPFVGIIRASCELGCIYSRRFISCIILSLRGDHKHLKHMANNFIMIKKGLLKLVKQKSP